jgi:hypothetical protein
MSLLFYYLQELSLTQSLVHSILAVINYDLGGSSFVPP